jgi:hypothetical protein
MTGVSIDIASAVEGTAAFVKLESGHCCNLLGRASNPRGLARVKMNAAESGGGSNFNPDCEDGAWSGVFEILGASDV